MGSNGELREQESPSKSNSRFPPLEIRSAVVWDPTGRGFAARRGPEQLEQPREDREERASFRLPETAPLYESLQR